MEYQCTRTRRKTIEIRVANDGGVIVRAPKNCSKTMIDQIVDQRRSWIEERKALVCVQKERAAQFWKDGPRKLALFGRECPVEEGSPARIEGERIVLPSLPLEEKKKVVVALYREALEAAVSRMVARFAPIVGMQPGKIGISGAARQWGSCSFRGTIRFSWRLALAPEEAVEYVVVHELCHLLYPNHSEYFWKEVERVLPDYRQRREKLKGTERILKEQGLGENG